MIFITKLPLVSAEEYRIFKPIPVPIPFDNNTIVLITPEVEYLALSTNNEKFFVLTENQWKMCKKIKHVKLCKGNQPVYQRSKSDSCEISLLSNKEEFPKSCKIKFLSLDTTIWHGLSNTSSWLYHTKSEFCTINCPKSEKNRKIEIFGTGRMTISPGCDIYTDNSINLPTHSKNTNVNFDLVPEDQNNRIISFLTKTLEFVLPQNFSNVKSIKDFLDLINKAVNINELQHKSTETCFTCKIELNLITLYVMISIVIVTMCIIVLKIKGKNIKMYEPELAENQSTVHEETNV